MRRLAFPVQFGKIVKILKEMVDTVTFDVTEDKFSAITLDGMRCKYLIIY